MKNMDLVNKIARIFLFLIGGIVAIYMFLLSRGTLEEHVSDDGYKSFTGTITDYAGQLTNITFFLMILGLLIVLGFTFQRKFSSKENIIKMLIGLGVAGLILLIAYSLSDDKVVRFANGEYSKEMETIWSGVGLIIFYIVFLVAIASIILSGTVIKLIKK